MKIGINLLYLIPGKVGGTETYAMELLPHLLSQGDSLYIFCGRETTPTLPKLPNCLVVELPIYSSNRVSRLLVEQTLLPWLCYKHQLDAIFSLGYSAPFLCPCPSVVTIHDLNWYYHPEDFGLVSRLIWKALTSLSAYTANQVITDSTYSLSSLIKALGLPPSKVTSILHGIPEVLPVLAHKSPHPYLFTVIADYPHKNLTTLLQAFSILSKRFPQLELIICGLGEQPQSNKRLKYLGYVTRAKLASLYRGAQVFVFPSAYEGFGYPVLEAMSYQVPVVSSSAASLEEVVGEGGVLVGAYDVDAYVDSITHILTSPSYRAQLIKRGKLRLSKLKWEDTAERTLLVIKKAMKHD